MKTLTMFALILLACTDEGATRKTLLDSGYSDITLKGYQPLACSQDDSYSTGFTAKNPTGRTVSGVVCCGFFKSCTVRF